MPPLKPTTVASYRSKLKEYVRISVDRAYPQWHRSWAKVRAESLEKRLAREGK
jgi:hypothetical protein